MAVTIDGADGVGNRLDASPRRSRRSADVVVYGATAAGVCAAVAAAQGGADVLLVEPGRHVGGMTSGGLGYTDVGDIRALGGMAAQFRAAVAEHYGVAVGRYAGPEPHVAEAILRRWLDDAGVALVTSAPLDHATTTGGRIAGIAAGDDDLEAAVFVDASYEGDLLAAAGVSFRIGRESRQLHGESFAGRREIAPGRHAMPSWISPFRDDPTGRTAGPLVAQVREGRMAEVGDGDGGVMAYGYRLCLSQGPDRIPFSRRAGYDPAHWELGRRLFARLGRSGRTVGAGELLGLEPNLPTGKADANSLGPFSLNVLDGSAWEYPSAGRERRERIAQHHRDHAQDLLWFLSTDDDVPVSVRRGLSSWGLAPDEFADTDHLPHQLYVREARRMVGEVVLTEHDLRGGLVPADVVAIGSYHLDIREVQRAWRWVWEHPDPVAMVVNEGYLSVRVPRYGIGYRSLLPRREECENLIVPVCLSASHVAFSSIRMEPQYQMLGQAAGVAAALAVRRGVVPPDVPVDGVQDALHRAGAVLSV